jgi:hypothetical protein
MCYSYLAQHLVVRVGRTEVITYGGDERRTHRADPCSLVSHALRFLVCARPVCLARFYPQALLQHAPTDHPHSCTRLAVKPRNKLRRGGELGAHAWCDVRTWPAILPKPRRHVGDLWSGDRLWSVAVLPATANGAVHRLGQGVAGFQWQCFNGGVSMVACVSQCRVPLVYA